MSLQKMNDLRKHYIAKQQWNNNNNSNKTTMIQQQQNNDTTTKNNDKQQQQPDWQRIAGWRPLEEGLRSCPPGSSYFVPVRISLVLFFYKGIR